MKMGPQQQQNNWELNIKAMIFPDYYTEENIIAVLEDMWYIAKSFAEMIVQFRLMILLAVIIGISVPACDWLYSTIKYKRWR